MPKIGFDSKFKRNSFFDYPKLKLKRNEKARIRIVDEPIAEFVHNLRKIVIENGEVQMTTKTWGSGENEKTREVPVDDFIGKFLCLGDPDTLNENDVDPDRCPACAAAITNASAVEKPKRRIVVHVLKYAVKKGSFEASSPFQAEVLAWDMPETRFSKLIEIAEEHGDLRQLDLCLGPCENEGFQKFEMQPGNGSVLADPDNRQRAQEILKANMSSDLTPLLGRTVTSEELQSQVNDILRQWDRGFGSVSAPTAGKAEASGPSLDFSSLVVEKPAEAEASADAPTAAPDLSSLASPEPVAEEASAPEPEEQKTSKTTEIPNLDDLLGSLK